MFPFRSCRQGVQFFFLYLSHTKKGLFRRNLPNPLIFNAISVIYTILLFNRGSDEGKTSFVSVCLGHLCSVSWLYQSYFVTVPHNKCEYQVTKTLHLVLYLQNVFTILGILPFHMNFNIRLSKSKGKKLRIGLEFYWICVLIGRTFSLMLTLSKHEQGRFQ